MNSIKTLALFPLLNSGSDSVSRLKKVLKEANYAYIPFKGNGTNALAIINISHKEAEWLNNRYMNTGFVCLSREAIGNYGIMRTSLRIIDEKITENFQSEKSRGAESLFFNQSLDEAVDFCMNKVGPAPLIHRGSLYKGLF